MDLLPTFAHLAGAGLDPQRKIDGPNIWPLLAGESGALSPYRSFYYYHLDQLQAVRAGPWKLWLPRSHHRSLGGRMVAAEAPLRLYNVVEDSGEAVDLASANPEVVRRLTGLAEEARQDLGDIGQAGAGQRSAGWVSEPQPLLLSPRAGGG